MDFCSAKGCSICNEEFDENERCPRILPCFHCFCTHCITQLINRNEKTCPFCRQSFSSISAKDLKVNYTTLELLKHINDIEAKFASSSFDSGKSELLTKGTAVSRSKFVEEMKEHMCQINKQNMTIVQIAENDIKSAIYRNEKLREEISVTHCILEYEIIGKLRALAKSYKTKLKYIDEVNADLRKQFERIHEYRSKINEVKNKLNAATKFTEVDEAVDEAEACNETLKTWLQNLEMFITKDEEAQQETEKNTETLQVKINSVREALHITLNENQQAVEQVAASLLKNLFRTESGERAAPSIMYNPSLKRLVAVQTLSGKTRWANFSIHQNNLCLHSLRDIQQLPPDAYIVEHRDVMSLVDPSFRTVFLDIGTAESTLGRILISLTPDTKRAQNFSLLCSGELGNSYVNTIMLWVWNKGNDGESILCGDYEFNDSRGGKALVPGAEEEEGGVLSRPELAGSVTGYSEKAEGAQFWITTRDNPGASENTVFGHVESGLHILRDAIANYPNIRDVRIKDCGIVFHL